MFVIPHGFVFAEETTKPVINTAKFAPNYHYYLDNYKQDPEGGFSISGSNFGVQAGKIINLDNNNVELTIKDWRDGDLIIYTKENIGKLILGPNRFILKTNDGIESDLFTITFEKYWIGPNILSIIPATIHLGDQVEITGENFGNSQPSNCPIIPSTTSFVQVACGVLDENNRPQKIISWSDTKIQAIVDNIDIGNHRNIRVVLHEFISNDDRTREGIHVYVEVLAPSCVADMWTCGDWNTCSASGTQTRICTKTFDCPTIITPSPITTQSCTPPCSADEWSCGEWNSCSANDRQTRICIKDYDCPLINTPSPSTSQSCTYIPPCTEDFWECSVWGQCNANNQKTRTCTNDCSRTNTPSPDTTQACNYTPPCNADDKNLYQ